MTWVILLERHIRTEERELFPLFEAHVDAVQAEQIGVKLKELLKSSKLATAEDWGAVSISVSVSESCLSSVH